MSEMVDCMARAMFERIAKRPTATHRRWETLPERGKNYYRADARAALVAELEPTAKMVMAGGVQLLNRGEYDPTAADGAVEIWRAMIDAALNE